MKNVHAYTDAIGVNYPAYISINEGYLGADNRPFKISLRDEGGGGTNAATTQIFMSREQLQKMADDINAYLHPEQDSKALPVATPQHPAALTEGQMDQIARAYFADEEFQQKAKDAIGDALKDAWPVVDRLSDDARRYYKLRGWMSSNVKEGWSEVEKLAAIACYMDWSNFDQALDSLPNCNFGLMQRAAGQVAAPELAQDKLDAERFRELNTPEIADFLKGVEREAKHQRARWGNDHDAGKAPEDWFWLLGYLGGKALHAVKSGDRDKGLHHTISSAAALLNWHAAILGTHTTMRPGIDAAILATKEQPQ